MFSVYKELMGIWLKEFENDDQIIEMSFKIIVTDFYLPLLLENYFYH